MNKGSGREIDYKALADFRYEIRRFSNFSEKAAKGAGIEPKQHQALLAIKGRSQGLDTTIGDLAERLQIRHNSAVELTRRLETHDWVTRSRSHSDAREVLLLLTAHGERLLEKLTLAHRDELRTAGPRLIQTLRSVISRKRNSMPSKGMSSEVSRSRRPPKQHTRTP
jgi:DNA-binding MarR family transcriptional regulator